MLKFINKNKENPIDLDLVYLFGKPPRTLLEDTTVSTLFAPPVYSEKSVEEVLAMVLQLESVACKDWLTNKVDRSVTGRVAKQQCAGKVQLPLNNLGCAALDYRGHEGVATAIGHATVATLSDAGKGSALAIAEALTNLVWAPVNGGLAGVSLSANWMWPAKNPGENARLYTAVQAVSDFAIGLGINIPTGKDSLSMTQKYPDGKKVPAPGTVIISAAGEVSDIRRIIEPVIHPDPVSAIVYIDFCRSPWHLGGSSFAQALGAIGTEVPEAGDPAYFAKAFNVLQNMIDEGLILAGHDVSAGGMITTLLEMCFGRNDAGMTIDTSRLEEEDIFRLLFSEKPGVIVQVKDIDRMAGLLQSAEVDFTILGTPSVEPALHLSHRGREYVFDVRTCRDTWYRTSSLLDRKQCGTELAAKRFRNYSRQELEFRFPEGFSGKLNDLGLSLSRNSKSGIKAAIIREKGVNGDREMAWMMHLAGFDVKDVHMTDLITGRENLEDLNFIVFVGGFSNSDVLGSAKGWAGAFLYNERAKKALDHFYRRNDTLSLGVCNGCQVMVELGLVYPEHERHPKMLHNASGKFESAFLSVDILNNESIMLRDLAGSRLGIWVAHGEGQFRFPYEEEKYHIPMKFTQPEYPGNPNGSAFSAAALCSHDGRHLVMMPHLERAIYPWNWAFYPHERRNDEITPWIQAFVSAREWIANHS
jgi:phosphoribosylformylglycinamidine synthase